MMALWGVGYKRTRLRTKGIDLSHHHEMVQHKAKKSHYERLKCKRTKAKVVQNYVSINILTTNKTKDKTCSINRAICIDPSFLADLY